MPTHPGIRAAFFGALALASFAFAQVPTFTGGTVRLTHTPDSGDGARVSSSGPVTGIPVPASRLNTGGFSLDGTNTFGSARSTGKAKAAHVTNSTTASLILRSGTGITQSDPLNQYLGFSRTEVHIPTPLTWGLGNAKFPFFTRYGSFTVAGNVGTGGFARFNANLTFRNESNQQIGSILLSTGTITTPGPFSRTLTASGPPDVLSGGQIRLSGTITFDVGNDEAPSDMVLLHGEAGGSQGSTYTYAGGTRDWNTNVAWISADGVPSFPGTLGTRVLFGESAGTFDQVTVRAGSSQGFGSIDAFGPRTVNVTRFEGSATLATSGNLVGRPNLRAVGGATLRVAVPIVVSGNGFGVEAAAGSNVQIINNGRLETSSGTGSLNILKTGEGSLVLQANTLPDMAITAATGTVVFPVSGVGVTASLSAIPDEDQTSSITVGRPITLTGLEVYQGGSVKMNRNNVATPNVFRGGNLFIEPGGQFDIANDAFTLQPVAGTNDPLHLFRRYIKDAYAGGAWTGDGITSSFAAADVEQRTGIGYVPVIGANPAKVGYALYGDSNMSGAVNIDDFGVLAANFNLPGDWVEGDFNYNGLVNIDDFAKLAANFNQTLPAGVQAAGVPEPTGLGVLIAAWTRPLRPGRVRKRPGSV